MHKPPTDVVATKINPKLVLIEGKPSESAKAQYTKDEILGTTPQMINQITNKFY